MIGFASAKRCRIAGSAEPGVRTGIFDRTHFANFSNISSTSSLPLRQ